MMRVLAVASTKGGVGKSTLAANLAVEAARAGEKVLLVDTDPQASSMLFAAARDGDLPPLKTVQLARPTVHTELPALAKGYGLVIVDTGGRDSAVFRSALAAATDVLIPVRPAAFDIWAVEDVLETVSELATHRPLNVYALLVQVVARARITDDALRELRRLLRQHEGRLLRTRIGSRVAWAQASGEGLSVTEFQPRSRAADELRGLVRELKVVT